jgi:hypothetical protein
MSSPQDDTITTGPTPFEVPVELTIEHMWKQFHAQVLLDKPPPLIKNDSPETVQRIIRATFMAGAQSVMAIMKKLQDTNLSDEDGAAVLARLDRDIGAYHAKVMQNMIERLANHILARMPPNG